MGFLLLALGLLSMAAGVVHFFKMKRMASAPFRRTGEIAAGAEVADPRGMVSAEGRIVALSAARAPCSGRACLFYEVEIERHWEKTVPTQKGSRKEVGKTRVATEKGGAVFLLDDGSGPLSIDARDGVDAELTTSHDQRIPTGATIPLELAFGDMRLATPMHLDSDRTVAFTAVERILAAEGSLYAYGRVANGAIGKPDLASLVLSRKGRAALVGGAKAKAAVGLVAGGLLTFIAIPAFLFAPSLTRFGAASDAREAPGTDTALPPAPSSPLPAPAPTPPPPHAAVTSSSPAAPSTPATGKKESGGSKPPAQMKKK
jgi:hypothetical protein